MPLISNVTPQTTKVSQCVVFFFPSHSPPSPRLLPSLSPLLGLSPTTPSMSTFRPTAPKSRGNTRVTTTGAAIAPGLAAGAIVCAQSTSAAGGFMGGAFSFGTTREDKDCNDRAWIATLGAMAGATRDSRYLNAGHNVACAFLRFPDDTIGAGVAKEVEVFLDKGLPVFDVQRLQGQFVLVPVRSLTGTVLDVEQTRATRKRFSPTADDPSTHPSIAHWNS